MCSGEVDMLHKIMRIFVFTAVVVIAYISIEDSNIIDGVEEIDHSAPMKMKRSIIVESYNVSFLIVPNGKGIKIYRGTMKKSALDKMDHIAFSTLDFSLGASRSIVEHAIKDIAKQIGANVCIIDSHGKLITEHDPERN